MVIKRDKDFRVAAVFLIIGLIVAACCFYFGLDLPLWAVAAIFLPLTLFTANWAIACGRTFLLDERGCTACFLGFRRTWRWEQLQTKRIVTYSWLDRVFTWGKCPYHKGAMFCCRPVKKRRFLGPPAYGMFHPWSCIYVNFHIPYPFRRTRLYPDYLGRYYEVSEEEFRTLMQKWNVHLEESI